MAATQWAALFRQAGLERTDAKSLAAELPPLLGEEYTQEVPQLQTRLRSAAAAAAAAA